jgi:hypothetical protein
MKNEAKVKSSTRVHHADCGRRIDGVHAITFEAGCSDHVVSVNFRLTNGSRFPPSASLALELSHGCSSVKIKRMKCEF